MIDEDLKRALQGLPPAAGPDRLTRLTPPPSMVPPSAAPAPGMPLPQGAAPIPTPARPPLVPPEVATYAERLAGPAAPVAAPVAAPAPARAPAPPVASGGEAPRPAAAPAEDGDPNSLWRSLSAFFGGVAGNPYDSKYWTGLDDRRDRKKADAKAEQEKEAAKRTALEDADPNSERSKRARAPHAAMLKQLGLGDEDIAVFTAKDIAEMTKGGNLAMKIAEVRKRAEADEEARSRDATELEAKRRYDEEQWRERADYQDKLIRGRKGGSGTGGGGPSNRAGIAATDAAVAREGITDDAVLSQIATLEQAAAAGDKKAAERLGRMAVERTKLRHEQGEQKTKEAKAAEADVQKQSVEYGQELRVRGLDRGRAALANVRAELSKYLDGEDVPGYGQTGSAPNWLLSSEGKAMRSAVQRLLDTELRMATGAAAPPSEQKTFKEILGTDTFATDADLRRALDQAERTIGEQEGYTRAMYPKARQAAAPSDDPSGPGVATDVDGDGRVTVDDVMANQPAAAPAVRIRDPKTGRTGTFPGTAEEARADGYEVVGG